MKAYGVKRDDISRCCPGHDRYPGQTSWAGRVKNRDAKRRKAKKIERARVRTELINAK